MVFEEREKVYQKRDDGTNVIEAYRGRDSHYRRSESLPGKFPVNGIALVRSLGFMLANCVHISGQSQRSMYHATTMVSPGVQTVLAEGVVPVIGGSTTIRFTRGRACTTF